MEAKMKNFNPRTPCGVRQQLMRASPRYPYFNPRTPCGVRLQSRQYFEGIIRFQSTHPLRGATPFCLRVPLLLFYFNPRTPCGVRLEKEPALFKLSIFQSTHPLRGATPRHLTAAHGLKISIHAPLAGCDCGCYRSRCRKDISIHAPLAGCDKAKERGSNMTYEISIHAPLAGCDWTF